MNSYPSKWFGNSKTVDSLGRPIVLYHGTGGNFDEFNFDSGTGKNSKTGSFFSNNPNVASTYAPGRTGSVMPVYLKLEKLVVINAKNANWTKINNKATIKTPTRILSGKSSEETDKLSTKLASETKEIKEKGINSTIGKTFPDMKYEDDYISTDDLARWARQENYKSIVINNVKDRGPHGIHVTNGSFEPSSVYVIFDNSLVKSATGNNGNFDSSDNILKESI